MSSKIIDLKQAVSLIWQTVELNKSEKGQAIVPYVFIVGDEEKGLIDIIFNKNINKSLFYER